MVESAGAGTYHSSGVCGVMGWISAWVRSPLSVDLLSTLFGLLLVSENPGGPGLCLKARRAGASSLTPRLSTTFNIV